MGKNYITAAEAKTLSETTEKLINLIFKVIKNEAENGYAETTFDLSRMSTTSITRLCDILSKAGFRLAFYYCEDANDNIERDSAGFSSNWIYGKVPLSIKICWY